MADNSRDIHPQTDGSFLIDGTATLRDINRTLDWDLDSENAKTLNGLLVEALESIPESATGIQVGNYYVEIIQVKDNLIKTVRMWRAQELIDTDDADG